MENRIFKNIDNEVFCLQYLKEINFNTNYSNFDEIFSSVKNNIEKYTKNIYKIESSIFYKKYISSPISSNQFIKNHLNLPLVHKKIFNNLQEQDALDYAEYLLQYGSITISPNDINSVYAYTNIETLEEFKKSWNFLSKIKNRSIELASNGDIFKIFLIKGKIVAVYSIVPAFVIGDGESKVSELIEIQNKNRKGNIFYKNIMLKNVSKKLLDIVPDKDEIFKLKKTTKLLNGAIFLDLTDRLIDKYEDVAKKIDNNFNDIDYIELTCLSNNFLAGSNDSSFVIQDIKQNTADFSELFSCISSQEKINNIFSYFKDNGRVEGKMVKSKEFKNIYLRSSTQTNILKEAAYRKGIKVKHVEGAIIQLIDTETNQNIFFNYGMSNKTQKMSRKFTNDKFITKILLQNAGINTPSGFKTSIDQLDSAWLKASQFKEKLVVKPLDGSGGVGVSTYIDNRKDFDIAWDICRKLNAKNIVIEECVSGNDYRIVVIDNGIAAVTQRIAAYVIGDGKHNLNELISIKALERKSNPFFALKKFEPNDIMIQYLEKKGLTLEYIPRYEEYIRLIDAVNIGSGGESIDRTDEVHPDWEEIAVQAKKAVLNPFHAGLDVMAEDISKSPHDQKWSIIEVNLNPDLGLQVFPKFGKPRDIAGSLLDQLFGEYNRKNKIINFSVFGKVQNVGYRNWLKKICNLRSIKGYVENDPINKNKVNIILCGVNETVDGVLKLCYEGPENAIVKKICLNSSDKIDFYQDRDFYIK